MKLAYTGMGVACINAIVQPFMPLAVFLILVGVQMCFTGPGIWLVHRDRRRQELVWKMDAAFGVPADRVQ